MTHPEPETDDERDLRILASYTNHRATPSTTRTYPRTIRETEHDPMAWWSSAEAEVAQEDFIRAQFNGERKGDESRASIWGHRVATLLAVGAAVLLYFGLGK